MINLKNTTNEVLIHDASGVALPPLEYVSIGYLDVAKMNDAQLHSWLLAGTIILNNGRGDYSPNDAIAKLSWSGTAWDIHFNNEGTDLSSDTVQNALIESRNKGNGFGWKKVPVGTEVVIPIDREMIVKKRIRVYGRLKIQGNLCLI